MFFFSSSLFGLPLFSNVAHSTITTSYKPDNTTNRWFNGQPSVYIQQVTHFQLFYFIRTKCSGFVLFIFTYCVNFFLNNCYFLDYHEVNGYSMGR